MESRKKIAVIITVHNRKKKTIECLRLLYKEQCSFDVYLTDDGCTDGTREMVKEQFPEVRIINGDGNLFWNRGMYVAFKEAAKNEYDFYLWLNDDTTFVPNFMKKLLDCSATENDESIICGATVDSEQAKHITYGGYTKSVKSLCLSNAKQVCYFASGNILLIPQKVYHKIGLNDYKYRHALGDFDYEGRANKLGIRVIQAPNYLGYCSRHEAIPKWRDSTFTLAQRLKHLYSPTGRNPHEFLYYDMRHNGLSKAILHYFTLHLRCIFPHLFCFNYLEKE